MCYQDFNSLNNCNYISAQKLGVSIVIPSFFPMIKLSATVLTQEFSSFFPYIVLDMGANMLRQMVVLLSLASSYTFSIFKIDTLLNSEISKYEYLQED